MKVNRTYTMELRTLELLARKKNKSLIVNLAVRQYMNHEDAFQLSNVETKKLLLVLNQRDDIPKHLKLLINSHLFE